MLPVNMGQKERLAENTHPLKKMVSTDVSVADHRYLIPLPNLIRVPDGQVFINLVPPMYSKKKKISATV
jgi:hypothetical protein